MSTPLPPTPPPAPPLAPTPGAAWRAQSNATAITTLPLSGLAVEVGRVHLDALLLAGQIPDLLTPIVIDMLWSTIGQGEGKEKEIEGTKQFFELVNIVVKAALVSPRVVDTPTADDEIAITDIDFGDRLIIYSLARQPGSVLHSFRAEQGPTMDALPEGDPLLEVAEPATQAG